MTSPKTLSRPDGYLDLTSTENKYGIPMDFVSDGDTVEGTFSVPGHLAGWKTEKTSYAHPGAVDAVLYATMGRSALFGTGKAAQVKSFSVEHVGLIPIDQRMTCQASVISQGRPGEALVEASIASDSGDIIATARAAFALFDADQLRKGLAGGVGACLPADINWLEKVT